MRAILLASATALAMISSSSAVPFRPFAEMMPSSAICPRIALGEDGRAVAFDMLIESDDADASGSVRRATGTVGGVLPFRHAGCLARRSPCANVQSCIHRHRCSPSFARNHQRKGSPSRRRATHVWDVLEPLAYANLTDIAGVQPTGSIEFTCGSRRASSSLRPRLGSQLHTATVNYRYPLWVVLPRFYGS
jgi:hypothetical protein